MKTTSEEIKAKIEKADIINFSALIGIGVFILLVVANLVFVASADNPAEAIKDVILWAMLVVNSIFLAYGITKKEE